MTDEKNGIVSRDPEVVSGELVFAGTRVPAKTLIDYLKAGDTLDLFWMISRRSRENRPQRTWT